MSVAQQPGTSTAVQEENKSDESSPPGNKEPQHETHQKEKEESAKEEVDLIDVVNMLQNKLVASGHTLDVPLPQIVVVGGQSTGKSSVLESFVQREFLPRGKDTVTRRPTIVQMFPTQTEEYVTFAHKADVKFFDFKQVKEEIEKETKRHPGLTGFSSDPISLKIYSPRVLKLTVVDLPGLIKNVEDGHAQTNVSEVRQMVLEYIRPTEALILAVTPATQEIVTSDAMAIAKEVDPDRERTIGVITKLDVLNDGTDFRDVLENRKIYLKKGYVGVVNRNQKEIEGGKDFQYILDKEKEFFQNHPAYRNMRQVMGVPYLVKMLQKTLRAHIKKFLPKVRSDVSSKLAEHKKELKNFEKRMGDSIGSTKTCGKQFYITKLILNFIQDIDIQIMGNSENVNTQEFSAGALINFKLSTEVKRNLTLSLDPNETQTQVVIVNQLGIRTAIAVPTLALDAINRLLLKQFKGPMEESVNCIKKVLEKAIADSAKKMDQYPSLKNEVIFKIKEAIEKEAENTQDRLSAHIDASMFCINFNYPDFDDSVCAPLAPPAGPIKLWENAAAEEDAAAAASNDDLGIPSKEHMVNVLKQNEGNQKNVKYASTLLMKCLEHVQKQMGDVAVKYISYFLVKKVLDFIKTELLPTLLEASNIDSITEDCEADFRWKEQTLNTCRILQEALNAIQAF